MNLEARLKQFHSYATHPMLSKRYVEIQKAGSLPWAEKLIRETAHLDLDGLAGVALRLSLMEAKPKAWLAIEELLICTCSALRSPSVIKQCGCGQKFIEVPASARSGGVGALAGWYWECICKSTLFVPRRFK